MERGIRCYHKKLRRYEEDGTTTRHIIVEENSDGSQLIVYEVRPAKDKYGYTAGYEFRPVTRRWFLSLKQGMRAAEKEFELGMSLRFYLVAVDRCAGK
jgi:hypothetical protein